MKALASTFIIISLFLFFSCASSAEPQVISDLEAMVSDYENTEKLEVKVTRRGKGVNYRTDYHYYQMLEAIENVKPDELPSLISWVEKEQKRLPAPILIATGNKIFPQNKGKALKIFQLGYMKSIYDSTRCTDKTSQQLRSIILMQSRELAIYARQHPEQYTPIKQEALKQFKEHDFNKSPLWICSHGIFAQRTETEAAPSKDLIIPKAKWEEKFKAMIIQFEELFAQKK